MLLTMLWIPLYLVYLVVVFLGVHSFIRSIFI